MYERRHGLGRRAVRQALTAARPATHAGATGAADETVFFCEQCGKKLSAPLSAAGVVGKCPVCRADVPVPIPVARDSVKRKTVRIAGDSRQAEEPKPGPSAVGRPDDTFSVEAIVGWATGILGIVLLVHEPRVIYASAPFLAVALGMGLRLMLRHHLVHGLALLLCICISAPALARQVMQSKRSADPPEQTASASGSIEALGAIAMDGGRDVVLRPIPVPPAPFAVPAQPPPSPVAEEERPAVARKEATLDDLATGREGSFSWNETAAANRSPENLGFESGMAPWMFHGDSVEVSLTTSPVVEGLQSLKMEGRWEGWGWNNAFQSFWCEAGEEVTVTGRIFLRRLDTTGLWLVAGIKLEAADGSDARESTLDPRSAAGGWADLKIQTTISRSGEHVLRCLVCGGAEGSSSAVVYFDDLRLERRGGNRTVELAPPPDAAAPST